MDLRAYYRKVRELEERLEHFVVLVSLETPDGGRAGVQTEAPRDVAARMIVGGLARLADEAETVLFRDHAREAKRLTEEANAAARLQVTVVPATAPRTSTRRE